MSETFGERKPLSRTLLDCERATKYSSAPKSPQFSSRYVEHASSDNKTDSIHKAKMHHFIKVVGKNSLKASFDS